MFLIEERMVKRTCFAFEAPHISVKLISSWVALPSGSFFTWEELDGTYRETDEQKRSHCRRTSFIAVRRDCIFYKLKVRGNPASGKSTAPFCQQHVLTSCLRVTFW